MTRGGGANRGDMDVSNISFISFNHSQNLFGLVCRVFVTQTKSSETAKFISSCFPAPSKDDVNNCCYCVDVYEVFMYMYIRFLQIFPESNKIKVVLRCISVRFEEKISLKSNKIIN